MSGAQVTDTDDRGALNGAEVGAIDPETERIARANGWKPRGEFKGDPDKWTAADVFVARGLEVPAILANRNKALANQVEDLRHQMDSVRTEFGTKLDDAVSTVKTLTEMNRTAEERAYNRARREITAEMEKAVEAGDTQAWRRLEQERTALEEGKPKPPEAKPAGGTQQPPPGTRQTGPTDPAVQRFLDDNPWYDPSNRRTDRDTERMAYADTIHNGLRTTQPNLTMEQNLAIVLAETRQRFPERFRAATSNNTDDGRTVTNGHDQGGNGGGGDDRRNEPPVVAPSSGTRAGGRRTNNRYSFDAMPQDSKTAYERYARVLEGKGPALTKEEWATDYWAQFRDDGNP